MESRIVWLLETLAREGIDGSVEEAALASATTFPSTSKVVAVLRPKSPEQVRECVAACAASELKVHAVSTGLNWGYGSRLPAAGESVVLMLDSLDSIEPIDPELGYFRLGPGVTFRALTDYLDLHHPEYSVSAPGSTTRASVLGNALDRGIGTGIDGDRVAYLVSVVAILGDGSILDTSRTRGMRYSSREGAMGPDLTGAFVQSNEGVVVAGEFRLRRRAPHGHAVDVVVKRRDLGLVLNAVQGHFRAMPDSALTVTSGGRQILEGGYANDPDLWRMCLNFESHSRLAVLEQRLRLRRALPGARSQRVDSILSRSDTDLVYGPFGPAVVPAATRNPDTDGVGLNFRGLALPFRSEIVVRAVEAFETTFDQFDTPCALSLRAFDAQTVKMIVPIVWPRGHAIREPLALRLNRVIDDIISDLELRPFRLSVLDVREHDASDLDIALCVKGEGVTPNLSPFAPSRYGPSMITQYVGNDE